ncbi:MAG: ribonuclease PH [Planctomycetaceae bacterium]|nr:ribonuclease PH [Planctomycetaceae bacterium]
MTPRHDGRPFDQLRQITVERPYRSAAPGSVLIAAGKTVILCTASVEPDVPPWKKFADPPTGWVTAEYSMLPGSTAPRKRRDSGGKVDGRSTEIQRLIGRSLRSVVDMAALGPRTITVDCDVLQADGGTRTLSITGGFLALVDAVAAISDGDGRPLRGVFTDSVAAVSVGVLDRQILLDLDYSEDSRAEVDMNVVMTGGGRYVEVQGTAEGQSFSRDELDAQLALAEAGIARLTAIQRATLGDQWPLDLPRLI